MIQVLNSVLIKSQVQATIRRHILECFGRRRCF
jgi:hypothetical protein